MNNFTFSLLQRWLAILGFNWKNNSFPSELKLNQKLDSDDHLIDLYGGTIHLLNFVIAIHPGFQMYCGLLLINEKEFAFNLNDILMKSNNKWVKTSFESQALLWYSLERMASLGQISKPLTSTNNFSMIEKLLEFMNTYGE